MTDYKPHVKIGYLGGGQLAQMLVESAHQMGLEAHVLSPEAGDPGALVTAHHHQASLEDPKALADFLRKVDMATFESEFLEAEKLIQAQKQTGTPIDPTPELMGRLQDRRSQKELFDQMGLPTSPWVAVDSTGDVEGFLDIYGFPLVFKKRFFGYDGYGTFVVKNQKQLCSFLQQKLRPEAFIVEKWIPFKRECALMIARSADKSFTHLPLVESFQKDSRCDWVKGPIFIKAAGPMVEKLKSFLKRLHYVGVMGVEFFLTRKGLIINEIAPRVHNTGHYSQATPGWSQFDLHNMCLLGQKLPKEIKIKGGFAMANLIGSGAEVKLKPVGGLHWYGKSENRRGRKMGHINVLASSPGKALKQALKKRKGVEL